MHARHALAAPAQARPAKEEARQLIYRSSWPAKAATQPIYSGSFLLH